MAQGEMLTGDERRRCIAARGGRSRRAIAMQFADDPKLSLPERVDAFEAWLCKDALERTRYKQKEAAERLGITYDQFRQRYRKYALGKE